ncbi:porin family protein [Rubrivivax sp. RP6-9]|uniref:porin family protein n=1 Tax=Rubrivivax sp. RP6-9 TaxID=3415750 RepID=UPI003CC6AA6A
MRVLRSASLALAGALLSSAVCAQTYLGVGVGSARVDFDCAGTTSCDRSDTLWKLYGGYMFTPSLGIEAEYFNQGVVRLTGTDESVGDVTAEFRGRGYGLFVLGAVPLGPVSLFGKLGAVRSKLKLDATSSIFGPAGRSEQHTSAAWGIGAGYAFTDSLGARLEFERIRVEFLDEKYNANLWTAGLHYRF